MKRIATKPSIVFVVSLFASTCLAAQTLPADRFLERVSAHPVGDQVEKDQAGGIARSLNETRASEVQRVLPAILMHSRTGNEAHEREYAAEFLLTISLRPDGAELLSSRSADIASLLLDSNPIIQREAYAVTCYIIGDSRTNKQPFVSALQTAIQRPQTPQDVSVGIITPLLRYGAGESGAVPSVLDFMQRRDLTAATRLELVHSLASQADLPTEVNRVLARELDDPDPTVRIGAVVAFADSNTQYHTLSKDRVASMANDSQEDPRVRELAKEALEGKTHLNPNIGHESANPNQQ